MSNKSSFFVSKVLKVQSEVQASPRVTKLPSATLIRGSVPSKFIKKWTDYTDDAAVQNSVSPVNGDMSFSLPIIRVFLTPLLNINIDMVYQTGKDGIEFEVPLTKNFISVDYQRSVFKNDATYYLNSMGSKMNMESVGLNKFKMIDDKDGEVDVTYYPEQQYFIVDSALEKLVYGKFSDTGTAQYELSYKIWRETGDDPDSLIKIPVAWYLAERHSKSDDRVIYYRYETVEVPHQLNPKVSYTSEVMLKSIDDGNDVKVQFEYGLKESSENEEMKLKNDDGNLRMGNFLVDKHFLNRIKVETETYEQDFGLTYDLFDGKTRVPKALTQVMSDGNSEEVLSFKNQKIFDKFLPSEIGIFHGVTTKFTYDNQVVASPLLEKHFLLKNRPLISSNSDVLSFASLVDNRMILKIFDFRTFKLVKEVTINDQRTIDEKSLNVKFSSHCLIITYNTDQASYVKVYHQTDSKKWEDEPTTFTYSKDAKIYTSGHNFVVVQDGKTLDVLQKLINDNKWIKYPFSTGDDKAKVFLNERSAFVREQGNIHALYRTFDGVWNLKKIKSGLESTATQIADLFDANDDVINLITKTLETNNMKVVNNAIIVSNLKFLSSEQFRIEFKFLTINDQYDVEREDDFTQDREKMSDIQQKFESKENESTLILKYSKSGSKYIIQVKDFEGKILDEINKAPAGKEREKLRQAYCDEFNKNEDFKKAMKGNFILDWPKYYPFIQGGMNDMIFSEDIQFRMTGTRFTKSQMNTKRTVKLGKYYELVFDNEHPESVKLLSQKDSSFSQDLNLHQSNMLINLYPYYIAYQSEEATTKIIIFNDGKSITKQQTFYKEQLMFESTHGYFMTIKKSEDASHAEPFELIFRNYAQFQTDSPHPVITTTEMWKDFKDHKEPTVRSSKKSRGNKRGSTSDSPTSRITKYDRSFKATNNLWTANVKMMNGQSTNENGWVEYYVTRNDEADTEQVTSYYDSDKMLLKSEKKEEKKDEKTDYSDNLLYDVTASLEISNFVPYKKSEDSFGYFGFENYEGSDGWTFYPKNVIKNGFALTGKNYLRLNQDDTFERSFMPKNKEELFIAAAWMRSVGMETGDRLDNFKALVSFTSDGKNFTDFFGILGNVKHQSGEWHNVEISIDFPTAIRMSFNDYRREHPDIPEYDDVDFKVTLSAAGTQDSEIDIDNIAFYPAAHFLDVKVFNDNRDESAAIQSDGKIMRIYYNHKTGREIGRTKKNGKLDQILVRSEGERDTPKTVTKFLLSSGLYETFDVNLYPTRWNLSNSQNFKVLPAELVHISDGSNDKIEVKDDTMMDDSSAGLRLNVSLDSARSSNFQVKFKSDSIEFESNGGKLASLKVNGRTISTVPSNFELAIYKYQKRTVIWVDGIIKFDEILTDTWKGFSMNFNGQIGIRDLFVINNPKIEIYYHNAFDEHQQVVKLESENSSVVTHHMYDRFGHETVKTKSTKVLKSASEPLLMYHGNFIKTFDPDTGKMDGDVVALNPSDEGFPYAQTMYHRNPLNEKKKVGQPGKKFSAQSDFATSYDKTIDIPFLNAYFPENLGFKKTVENLSNGSQTVLVFDKDNNKVAKYVQVPNFDDILTTIEFDSEKRIVKILSPQYHVAAGTMTKINVVYTPGDDHLSPDEKKLQDELGIHQKYDDKGNLVEKRTPDVGRQTFLYDSKNLLKFSITHNADPTDGQTIYYNYDNSGALSETGYITRPVSIDYLSKFTESNFHTQATEFQKIQFNEGKSKTIATVNHELIVSEDIQFDENDEDKIVTRRLAVPTLTDTLETSFEVNRKYNGENVEVLTYPTTDEGKTLEVKNTYNGVGQLIGIGTVEKPFCFAKFTYDANGQPTSEVHELNNLNRNYSYNSPGYLNKIDDDFLTEDITYIDGGYGQRGYGDGIVMKTAYNAKWSDAYFNEGDDSDSDNDYVDRVVPEESRNGVKLRKNQGRLKMRIQDLRRPIMEGNINNDEHLRPQDSGTQKARIFGEGSRPDNRDQQTVNSRTENQQNSSSGDQNKPESSSRDTNLNKIRHEGRDNIQNSRSNHINRTRMSPSHSGEVGRADSDSFEDRSKREVESDLLNNHQTLGCSGSSVTRKEPRSSSNHVRNRFISKEMSSEEQGGSTSGQLPTPIDDINPRSIDCNQDPSNRSKRDINIQETATKSRDEKIAEVIANPDDDACIKSLKKLGIISKKGFLFKRALNTNEEVDLPLKCYDSKIYDEISAKYQIPKFYGHRYTYGNHRELVKAKYFSTNDEEAVDPLQMQTYMEKMTGITLYQSHNIFNTLRDGNYIAVDQLSNDKKSSIATRGATSMLRDDDLNKLLDNLSQGEEYDFHEVFSVTKQLIFNTIADQKVLSYDEFEKIFLKWKNADGPIFVEELKKLKRYARKLYDGLVQQKLLPTSQDTMITPINAKLVTDLKKYQTSQVLDIVNITSKIFNNQIQETAFDTVSHEIDANGNHKAFTTGFETIKLDYQTYTSKLKTLKYKGKQYTVDHDGYGNMTSAPHKGVKKIIYHPVSRRVMEVLLTNGGSIKFHYNSQGERILKQVYDSKYEITKEILYIRDEDGNVLMDRVMNFDQKDKTCYEVVTHYIYGPRGMIGFIRDDKFHSIFTDHSGSVRLVIRDGKVVASYDYLPYGEMMRKFISDDNADIRYLFQGKELDVEIDMYNYHARFYDPTIGRFLQTDPQSQYFSPYKFSGNNPVSFVDPDGEFAFLLILAFVALGAYLSAAAHNKSFNPAKWNWKDPGTYVSLIVGGVMGGLMPGSIAASIASYGIVVTASVMLTTAFVSVAVANKSWNPADWKFDDPETYSALFFGLGAGASGLKDIASYKAFALTLTKNGKIALYTFTAVAATSAFYVNGVVVSGGNAKFWQWDFTNPEIFDGVMKGFDVGVSYPMTIIEMGPKLKKLFKKGKEITDFLKTLKLQDLVNLKDVLKDRNHPLYKFLANFGAGFILKGAKNKDFIPMNWVSNAGSYSTALNTMKSGQNLGREAMALESGIVGVKTAMEFKNVRNVVKFVKKQYVSFAKEVVGQKSSGIAKYRRYIVKNGQVESEFLPAMQGRIRKLAEDIDVQKSDITQSIVRDSQLYIDRSSNLLGPCASARRRRFIAGGGTCRSFGMNWNAVKDNFVRADMNPIFENAAVLPKIPADEVTTRGYVTLSGPGSGSMVQPGDVGVLDFTNKPTSDSMPGLVAVNRTVLEVDTSTDRQRRQANPVSIVMTDQVPGTALYIQENAGKLKIYHQYREPESKIALTTNNKAVTEFYETKEGVKVKELAGLEILKLFNSNNEEIKMRRGALEIPDDGVVRYIKDGQFQVLKSINGLAVTEVARRNKEIRQRNAEMLAVKLPNFNENCDTCKVIYWEDHLPVGVIDTAYNLNIDRQLKATVVIYKDDKDNWKLSSQLIQYNKEKAGAPEIAEIRPKPKIFDLKLTAKKAEEDKDNQSRKPRNVNFVPEDSNVPARNYKFIDSSTQNFNHQTPSVLELGDFWLNATDFNSNLTLAYAFLKKWTNETLFSTNEGNMPKITDIEFEIFANDLTNDFTENILESALKCGIPTVMRDILDEINLQKISNEVKRKCEKNLTEEIPKYLMKEILEKNEKKIVGKSSKKQFEKLKKLMTGYLEDFADDLTARNDKLWNGE
ncbi:unnamed protein product [Chironomus riparius]|uniref:Uncharacterized protein n=1 Tax=Chironomus riparius TaxID=315576 RepID=A0A9N9S6F3_9DIPT|nr:unnamed protein product [Chironomus riparius]